MLDGGRTPGHRGKAKGTWVMCEPAVEADGLRKAFGEVQALDGLSLRLERGEVLGLLGPNGSGNPVTEL